MTPILPLPRAQAVLTGIALLLAAGSALAQPAGGPPAAARQACQSHTEGAACRFTAPHGDMQGQCRSVPEGGLACVPTGGPGGRMPGTSPSPSPGGLPTANSGAPGATPPSGLRVAIRDKAAGTPSGGGRIPDTRQGDCFDDHGRIPCPAPGTPWSGQDAQHSGPVARYRDNGDGTLSDPVTGLTWQKAHHATRLDYAAASAACHALRLGGQSDWRLPEIKELFSLADFRGAQGIRAFIDDAFEFRAPGSDVLSGDRFAATHHPGMMGQTWSATRYTGVHYGRPGVEAAFFFNFLDGHIKQAPTRGRNTLFYRCVRGPLWGANQFSARSPAVVEDQASGLLWQQKDDGQARDWRAALAYCQSLTLDGLHGWRLPNVKELQSIVDYSRHAPALDTRHLATSDPRAWYWSSTTHGDNIRHAAYVCFGPCTDTDGLDVHGAGAQRSSPKAGDAAAFGPLGGQRDEVRTRNLVRCVRSAR